MNTLTRWHEIVKEGKPELLDEILEEGCVLHSPVVHTPQVGKDITKLYLAAATESFSKDFRYVKEVANAEHAVLEFVCEIDGVIVNGVDIISFGPSGKIKEFRVMVRPLKAVGAVHEKMKSMLEALSSR